MMIDVTEQPDWRRLGEHVARRRRQLGLTQKEVNAAGGPTDATIRKIEGGEPGGYSERTLTSLEAALKWPKGTIGRLLNGENQAVADDDPNMSYYAARLVEIRDNPDRSPGLRSWAAATLAQISQLYDADDAERRAS